VRSVSGEIGSPRRPAAPLAPPHVQEVGFGASERATKNPRMPREEEEEVAAVVA